MKIAAGIIIFNSDFVLKEVLDSIYGYVDQIIISEGCVQYFQDKGFTTSTDKTNEIIHNFPDPEKKITIIHGQYKEKTEQANAYIPYIKDDTDYLWNLDSDEIYKGKDIEKIIDLLEKEKYTSVGFNSNTFYGGFDKIVGGFEKIIEYKRIFKIDKNSKWATHRPPIIDNLDDNKHLSGRALVDMGIYLYHYSYVFSRQVKQKMEYYQAAVSKSNCIDNYYKEVWLKWMLGDFEDRYKLEEKYKGVHDLLPEYRGLSFTESFVGSHPKVIENNLDNLKKLSHVV